MLMKHSLKITILLILLFFFSQLIGLSITSQYIDKTTTLETGNFTARPLPSVANYEIERPVAEDQNLSFIPVIIAVLIGTILLLVLIKFRARLLWKVWFFVAIAYTLFIALNPWVEKLLSLISPVLTAGNLVALGVAIVLAALKVFRNNVYIQNITELFLYGGLAAIFFDYFNLLSISILLIVISLYDMFAVWQSKHMIKLANFQTESKVFAGLMVPYSMPKKAPATLPHEEKITVKVRNAILGGGDIGFPLLFSSVVMKYYGFGSAVIIAVAATIALSYLLIKAEKDKFYPAMPFLSAGCFAGLGLVYLLQFIH